MTKWENISAGINDIWVMISEDFRNWVPLTDSVWEVKNYSFSKENTAQILKEEVGQVFAQVLEYSSVYARTAGGKAAFERFEACVNC